MKDGLLCLVIDASGSMNEPLDGRKTKRQATIEGVNSFLADQRSSEGRTFVSVTLFNTTTVAPFVGFDVRELPDLGAHGLLYVCHGGTAMYDAIGATVKGAELWLSNHQDFDGTVAVVIATDGKENSSALWHANPSAAEDDDWDVNNLIRYKQGEGWEFIYLGAGPDAWAQSQQLSAIPAMAAVQFDSNDITRSYAGASQSYSMSRSTGTTLLANVAKSDTLNSIRRDQDTGGGTGG